MVVQLTMQRFARGQLSALVDSMVFELHQAVKLQTPEAIHKMRVSIRRLVQGLRVFRQYVPDDDSRKLQKQLRRVMKLSSAVRDLDIALKYMEKQGQQPEPMLAQRLESKRALLEALSRFGRPDLALKWRIRLQLGAE